MRLILLHWRLTRRVERVQMWLAWHSPKWLVRWCVVRVVAVATTGQHGETVLPDITAMEALKRFG